MGLMTGELEAERRKSASLGRFGNLIQIREEEMAN